MKKQILCLALLLCGALALPPAVGKAGKSDAPNCHEMAEQWFGASLLSAEDPGSPTAAASEWFARREGDFRETGTAVLMDAEGVDGAAEEDDGRAARLAGIEALQARAEITITDADVTAQTDYGRTRANPDGTVTMFVYEWTFLDYDDLSDGPGGRDVMGYGVWHKLTLAPAPEGGAWRIVRDEYDESELLGVCTVTEETRLEPEAALLLEGNQPWEDGSIPDGAGGGIPADADGEGVDRLTEGDAEALAVLLDTDGAADLMGPVDFYPAYDPDAASEYADKYALTYNPAFPNYNPVGGDCANFTSQCILAGGMPMVKGSNGWYHKLASTSVYSDRSGSWTLARELYNWMSANRGVQMTAADDTVIKGSPVFYVNKGKTAVGHAAICVGANSAGRPIIDSHNSDKYHAPWNYTVSSPAIYTVQLTGDTDLPLSIAGERCPPEKLGVGTGFGLRGVIRSGAIITKISADILDGNGIPLPDFHYETAWDDYRYDIRTDGLNDAMMFDQLEAGNYTYMVRAEDADSAAETLVNSPFAVVESAITITGETLPPNPLKTGNSFRLQGIIQSSLPLTKITACVFDDTGTAVSEKFTYVRSWSSETYDIYKDGLNSAFVFNNLKAGEYLYTVSATDSTGTTAVLIDAPFSVSAFSGTLEAPSITVDGARVFFSWTTLSGAESWQAVLAKPETGEALYIVDLSAQEAGNMGEQPACVMENVSPGVYEACVLAYAGDEALQSPSALVSVGGGTGGDGTGGNGTDSSGTGGHAPSVTVQRTHRDKNVITVSTLIAFDWEERGDAVLAAAAYQDDRLICSCFQGEIAGTGSTKERITLNCPEDASFDEATAVRLFLLDEETLTPLMETVFVLELSA
ncbi:MAG: amidase domain-containing protein [Oscillibacter sp.]|nr:amidase domain-containing protein [Oscillibacter sp.]